MLWSELDTPASALAAHPASQQSSKEEENAAACEVPGLLPGMALTVGAEAASPALAAGGQAPGPTSAAQSLDDIARVRQRRARSPSHQYERPGRTNLATGDSGHFSIGTINQGDLKAERHIRDLNMVLSPVTILLVQEATLRTQLALEEATGVTTGHYAGWTLQVPADGTETDRTPHQQGLWESNADSALAGDGGLLTVAQARFMLCFLLEEFIVAAS